MDEQLVVAFIPAFNEEERIGEVIKVLRRSYIDKPPKGWKLKIVLVDDGSTDRTVDRAHEAGVDRIVSHPVNMGLGAATRTGMRTSYDLNADIAVKVDADYQHDPLDIEKCIQPILEDRTDLVWGSRFAGKITYKMPLHRRLGNRFFSWLMRKLTYSNITDAQTGLMLFSRKYLAVFRIISNYNPPQQLLIDAHGKGMRYMEVPVIFHPRTTGKSFVSYKYPMKVLTAMFRILVYANPLRVFVPLGVALIVISISFAVFNLIEYVMDSQVKLFRHDMTIMLFFMFGVQVIIYGLLADLIAKRGE